MRKKYTQRMLRVALIVGSIASLFFVPWLLVKAWILPLPDTLQEQVEEAIGHGFDGMIVYVDQGARHRSSMRLAGTTGNPKYRPKPMRCLKLRVSVSYMMR